MIKYIDKLYVSEEISDTDKIKKKIRRGAGSIDIFVIALRNGSDQLEYFHNGLFKQKIMHSYDVTIVGFAKSEADCLLIIEQIMKDTIEVTGTYDMKSYLLNCWDE
ncbi:MAG: hypothetical protein KBT19_07595 [Lachnospiraceae bacterium]|nr:hypothetical protein [Candidatus Colinaster equi]